MLLLLRPHPDPSSLAAPNAARRPVDDDGDGPRDESEEVGLVVLALIAVDAI